MGFAVRRACRMLIRGKARFYVCPGCMGDHRIRVWTCVATWLLLVGNVVAAIYFQSTTLGWVGLALFVACIVTSFRTRLIAVTSYRKPKFCLKGFSPAFVRAFRVLDSAE